MKDMKLIIVGVVVAVLVLGGVGYAVMHSGSAATPTASVSTPAPADERPGGTNANGSTSAPANELPSGSR